MKSMKNFHMVTKNFSIPDDVRSETRTVLRVGATILFKDAAPMHAKTIDIGLRGMALLSPEQVTPGTLCGIRFSAMIQGKMTKVEAVARVVYSICVGTAGFRIGYQFTDMDSASKTAVTQIVNNLAV
jgi:c-di-GMP-binding flagellar brake protein YcgR